MNVRFFTLVCSCMLGFLLVNAQEVSKKVVFVDYFSHPSSVDDAQVEVLRGKVIEGIQETERVQVIDVASQKELSSEEQRRKAESAMGDLTARTSEMRTLGANFIITGDVSAMNATERKDDKGKISYKGIVHWTIKVIDAETGTLKTTKSFQHDGITGSSGDTKAAAISETCDYAKISMEDFIDDTFPIEGTILKVEMTKKNKAQTVYIDLGSALGVTKGQKFSVFLETDIAGELARTEIGSLSAQEVLSGKRTLCKVAKGGEEVLNAMNKGQKLIVVSRKARTVLDLL